MGWGGVGGQLPPALICARPGVTWRRRARPCVAVMQAACGRQTWSNCWPTSCTTRSSAVQEQCRSMRKVGMRVVADAGENRWVLLVAEELPL